MSLSFRGAFVIAALTAFSVTFLTSLAESDAARSRQAETGRAKPAAMMTPPVPAASGMRVIELGRRAPSGQVTLPASVPVRQRVAGAA